VPDLVSYCRLVQCAKESAGTRYGTSGTKSGNASLKWAFSEAAVWCLRHHPVGQNYRTRFEKTHRKGTAFTVFAPPLARAVYSMLQRPTACDRQTFLQGERRGADEPTVSLDDHGMSLRMGRCQDAWPASRTQRRP
jgi:hypothetical protein